MTNTDLISREAAAYAAIAFVAMCRENDITDLRSIRDSIGEHIRALPAVPAPAPHGPVAEAARVLLDHPKTLHAALSKAMADGYSVGVLDALIDIAGGAK